MIKICQHMKVVCAICATLDTFSSIKKYSTTISGEASQGNTSS